MKLWIKAVALAAVTALAACGGGPTRRVVTDISIGSGQSVQGSFTGGAVPLLGERVGLMQFAAILRVVDIRKEL